MWPQQASPSLQRLEAAEIILGFGYRTGSRADTCSSFLGDTHERGPTISRCYGLSTRFKAGAHDLYNASSTHSPPETTPMRTPSIQRIGHTQKRHRECSPWKEQRPGSGQYWTVSHGSPGGSSATCHMVLFPHNSDGSLCYSCTFPGSLWPKLAAILIWFSVHFKPMTRVTPATPFLLCATVHAELDLKPNSRLFLGTPVIALRLTPVLHHDSGPLWAFLWDRSPLHIIPQEAGSGPWNPRPSPFPEHGMFQKSEPSFPF